MDSGKDFLFWHSFPLFWPQNLAVFGVIASFPESGFHRWEIPKSGFYRGTDQFSNARMMASCSGQLFRKSGSIKLEPEFRKINTAKQWSDKMQMASWALLNCVCQGLKWPKNYFFQIFHVVQTYKKYILQKKWSKNLIPAPGNGKSNLPPPYMRLPPPTR